MQHYPPPPADQATQRSRLGSAGRLARRGGWRCGVAWLVGLSGDRYRYISVADVGFGFSGECGEVGVMECTPRRGGADGWGVSQVWSGHGGWGWGVWRMFGGCLVLDIGLTRGNRTDFDRPAGRPTVSHKRATLKTYLSVLYDTRLTSLPHTSSSFQLSAPSTRRIKRQGRHATTPPGGCRRRCRRRRRRHRIGLSTR